MLAKPLNVAAAIERGIEEAGRVVVAREQQVREKAAAPPREYCDLIAIGADVRSACSTRFQTRTPFALRTGSQFAVERVSDSASAIVRDGAAALYFAVTLRSPRALSNDTTAARAATPTHSRTGVAGFCAIRFREHRSQAHSEGSREAHRFYSSRTDAKGVARACACPLQRTAHSEKKARRRVNEGFTHRIFLPPACVLRARKLLLHPSPAAERCASREPLSAKTLRCSL